ncbi:MAG: GDSL-type esterase/lipase family protein, partial [Acidimicrobiia bacterium]
IQDHTLAATVTNLTTINTRAKAAAPLAEIVLVGEQYASLGTGATQNVGFSTWTDTWIPAFEQVARDTGATWLDHNAVFGDCSDTGDPWDLTMDAGLHFGVAGQRARAEVSFARLRF